MQLVLTSGEETVDPQGNEVVESSVDKGKGRLRRTTSFLPGRGQDDHLFAPIAARDAAWNASQASDNENNDEHDSEDDEDLLELTQGMSSRVSEAMAMERPSWQAPTLVVGSSASVGLSAVAGPLVAPRPLNVAALSDLALTEGRSGNTAPLGSMASIQASPFMTAPMRASGVLTPTVANTNTWLPLAPTPTRAPLTLTMTPALPPAEANKWPADTELLFPENTRKLRLTFQYDLVRVVIQDSFVNVRAALIFEHAFPDVSLSQTFVRDALLLAAKSHMPGATSIHARVQQDAKYLGKIAPLVNARMCLFRSKVKEYCAMLIKTTVLGLGSSANIIQYVKLQHNMYNYMFPKTQSLNQSNLVTRSWPYRNDRIIKTIQHLFFTGERSLATNFSHCFPTSEGSDGVTRSEVPEPMVALVATALYVALYEWRSGTYHSLEFATNSFLDVYQGHLGTIAYIRENRVGAYHAMMIDIYDQASASMASEITPAPIAELDLEELED